MLALPLERRMRTTAAAAALIIVVCLTSRGITAAQGLGAVGGVVKDQTGSVLPGVAVRVVSVELVERVRTTVTDATGRYRVANLPPGAYTITFTSVGFRPIVRVDVAVSAGLTTAVDADMLVGPPDSRGKVPGGPGPLGSIASAAQRRPYVRCGLTIVPADPRVDPKIRVPLDQGQARPSVGSGMTHPMRTIAPRVCAGK